MHPSNKCDIWISGWIYAALIVGGLAADAAIRFI